MNASLTKPQRLEEWLAGLLSYGSWLASAVIGAGLVLGNMRVVQIGILLFISLPTLRLLLMFFVFLRERDYRFALTSALVLGIIFLGFVLGIRMHSALPG